MKGIKHSQDVSEESSMKDGPKEDDLIGKILNETLSLNSTTGTSFSSSDKEQNQNNINSNELEFLILKKQLNYFTLDYLNTNKVFRTILKNQIIDFPINWYFFKKIFENRNGNKNYFNYIFIDQKNDSEKFLVGISSVLMGHPRDLLIIYNNIDTWICYSEDSCGSFIKEIVGIENVKAA